MFYNAFTTYNIIIKLSGGVIMIYESCVLLAGAIIKQAIRDRRDILAGVFIPGQSIQGIDAFFGSELFEHLAGDAADYIRDHLEEAV